MSTFGGKIQEIPNISVDRFDNENIRSEAFFLSHCHTDHMVGLNTTYFQNMLVNDNKCLYASKISCVILSKMYPNIKNNLRELSMYQPTFVILKNGNLSVIPMPAGHCPGSVMFLFENDKCILYTGDFRVDSHDLKKFKPLYDSFKHLKTIHKIYLDTTFFLKSYLRFPKRDEILDELCKVIKAWIELGNSFTVGLKTSARYGYEYLFIEIYERLGMPVHVNDITYNVYCLIPDMDKAVTLDKLATQIHSHCGPTFKALCDVCTSHTKIITISAMRWKQKDLEVCISKEGHDDVEHFICYSTHNSYEETSEIIKFLRPKEIEVCVKHDNPIDNKEILDFIRNHSAEHVMTNKVTDEPKLFKIKGTEEKKHEKTTGSLKDSLGIFDSPPLIWDDKDNKIQKGHRNRSDIGKRSVTEGNEVFTGNIRNYSADHILKNEVKDEDKFFKIEKIREKKDGNNTEGFKLGLDIFDSPPSQCNNKKNEVQYNHTNPVTLEQGNIEIDRVTENNAPEVSNFKMESTKNIDVSQLFDISDFEINKLNDNESELKTTNKSLSKLFDISDSKNNKLTEDNESELKTIKYVDVSQLDASHFETNKLSDDIENFALDETENNLILGIINSQPSTSTHVELGDGDEFDDNQCLLDIIYKEPPLKKKR